MKPHDKKTPKRKNTPPIRQHQYSHTKDLGATLVKSGVNPEEKKDAHHTFKGDAQEPQDKTKQKKKRALNDNNTSRKPMTKNDPSHGDIKELGAGLKESGVKDSDTEKEAVNTLEDAVKQNVTNVISGLEDDSNVTEVILDKIVNAALAILDQTLEELKKQSDTEKDDQQKKLDEQKARLQTDAIIATFAMVNGSKNSRLNTDKVREKLASRFIKAIIPNTGAQEQKLDMGSTDISESKIFKMLWAIGQGSAPLVALAGATTLTTLPLAPWLTPVIAAITLAFGAFKVVHNVFKYLRGSRTEADEKQVLGLIGALVEKADSRTAPELTRAFVAGAEQEFTGTKKESIRKAVLDAVKRKFGLLGQNKIIDAANSVLPGRAAQVINSLTGLNIGGRDRL